MITVSVCVTAYNHVNYLKDCIDGILKQRTKFDVEVLLGEDDSTDGTREIAIEYSRRYPNKIRLFLHDRSNVIYINGNPTGRYNSLNNFKHARGKYIAICEGDDYWTDPLKLQKQVNFLEENPQYSICYHRCTLSNPALKVDNQSTESYTFSFWESLQKKNGYTLSMVFRADIIKELDLNYYLEGLTNGDWPLECLLTLKQLGYYINESMGCYRIHDSGYSKYLNAESFINTRLTFMSRIRTSIGQQYREYIDACMGRLYILRIKQLIVKKEILTLLICFPKFILKIIQYKPWYRNKKIIWVGPYKIL